MYYMNIAIQKHILKTKKHNVQIGPELGERRSVAGTETARSSPRIKCCGLHACSCQCDLLGWGLGDHCDSDRLACDKLDGVVCNSGAKWGGLGWCNLNSDRAPCGSELCRVFAVDRGQKARMRAATQQRSCSMQVCELHDVLCGCLRYWDKRSYYVGST